MPHQKMRNAKVQVANKSSPGIQAFGLLLNGGKATWAVS